MNDNDTVDELVTDAAAVIDADTILGDGDTDKDAVGETGGDAICVGQVFDITAQFNPITPVADPYPSAMSVYMPAASCNTVIWEGIDPPGRNKQPGDAYTPW